MPISNSSKKSEEEKFHMPFFNDTINKNDTFGGGALATFSYGLYQRETYDLEQNIQSTA